MNGDDPAAWTNVAIAAAGAAAALTGLLFLAVSFNLQRILAFPRLPGRAAGTLATLVLLLILSLLVLTPQPVAALAVELIAVGLCVGAAAAPVLHRNPGSGRLWFAAPVLALLPAFCLITGGVLLLLGTPGAMFFFLAALIGGFLGASFNAWVLLVEVQR